jgi:hypothetical protein
MVLLNLFSSISLDNFRIDWSTPDRYEIVRRVGGGRYSEVGFKVTTLYRCTHIHYGTV